MKIKRRRSIWRVLAILTVAVMVPTVAWKLLERLNARYDDSGFAGAQLGFDALVNSPTTMYWIERGLLTSWCISCMLWVLAAGRDLFTNERRPPSFHVDKERRRS